MFAETAAHTWMGWDAGESGRLIAESFRTATTPTLARALFVASADIDVSAEAGLVTAEALVLHRQGERQMPVEMSRQLAAALPNGRLQVLDGSTPTLFFENPDHDVGVIGRFLLDGTTRPEPATVAGPDGLTVRELAVLRLVAGGESNAEIAGALGISVHTVERHVANLYRKIRARGRADATGYALRNGLV